MEIFAKLKAAPQRLASPDYPSPTSPALTKSFYKGAEDIVDAVNKMLGKNISLEYFQDHRKRPHDVPGDWFKGPF